MLVPRARALGALAAALLLVPALTACSEDDSSPGAEEQSPEEVLAKSAQTLTQTTGVRLDLATSDLPPGVTGITKAAGVATAAPAFEGTISVVLAGQSVDVPVVAVDDKVYAQIPFTPGWNVVDPTEYGAPDPARLIDPSTGFPALLTLTEDPTKGESVRGGADNSEVLTTYTGTVPGDAMAEVIPSAAGDSFDVEWQVSDDGELRQADLTGVFYADSQEMTYTVEFSDYGTDKNISAP